ncbi:hypothetical protein [Mongoliitalea daihaiensis]|uniref:hypothetical protein n=1 Tax=Mongoliitalea daihaiensis TaxID=2782006 RepID=UPI001F27F5AA|nr:hypothetical protein [Mongoliitalea daihaiensis]UJP63765.1 hypothetical protein IPZ59_13110 [Mongoliitalea daihaiensis]
MKKRILIYIFLLLNLLIIGLALTDVGNKIIWHTTQPVEQFQANEVEQQFYVQ